MTVETNPVFNLLSKYTVVTEEEKAIISELVFYKSFKKNEVFHLQGQLTKYFAIVGKGALRFFYTDAEGEEHTIDFAFENEPAGEFDKFMKAAPSSASAHALEDIELVGFSLENFTKFMELYPHYYKVINDVLAQEMAILAMRSRLLRIPSSRERYTQLCKEHPELLERVPLTHIASYLKMALGTLSRVRAGKL